MSGRALVAAPLSEKSFIHPTKDLSVFHLADEEWFYRELSLARCAVEEYSLAEEPCQVQTVSGKRKRGEYAVIVELRLPTTAPPRLHLLNKRSWLTACSPLALPESTHSLPLLQPLRFSGHVLRTMSTILPASTNFAPSEQEQQSGRGSPSQSRSKSSSSSSPAIEVVTMKAGDEESPFNTGREVADSAAGAEEGGEDVRMMPLTVPGTLLARSSAQVFARTDMQLEMGMCGGPVLNAAGECLGLVEGIVPALTASERAEAAAAAAGSGSVSLKARQLLAGSAVFVECDAIRDFLSRVEQSLQGGGRGEEGQQHSHSRSHRQQEHQQHGHSHGGRPCHGHGHSHSHGGDLKMK